MAAALSQDGNQDAEGNLDDVTKLAKQWEILKEDMTALILNFVKPLQTLVDALRDTVNSFRNQLTSTETIAGENFERPC